jgi:hypothetical protein
VTKILRSDIQVTHLFLPFEEKKERKENKTSFSSARDTKSQAIDIFCSFSRPASLWWAEKVIVQLNIVSVVASLWHGLEPR